jgi:hypothetical protein
VKIASKSPLSPQKKSPFPPQIPAGAAAAAGAAMFGFPMIAKGQTGPVSLRFQSTCPPDIFHEYALDFAKSE